MDAEGHGKKISGADFELLERPLCSHESYPDFERESKEVCWKGGRAISSVIRDIEYEGSLSTEKPQWIFAFRSSLALGEARSYGEVKGGDAPKCAFVFPPGLDVYWHVKRLIDQELLVVELDDDFLLRSAELEHLPGLQLSDGWYHEDPLHWQLGRTIYDECTSNCR